MGELTNDEKCVLIYTDERLKELDAEHDRLEQRRKELDAISSMTESEKRYRIYIAERMPRLAEERRAAVATRRRLTEPM
ncbi:MAG: hypothetical protein RIQ75_1021 [Pseudomonadota bacterium]|jgi:hypothetical protein